MYSTERALVLVEPMDVSSLTRHSTSSKPAAERASTRERLRRTRHDFSVRSLRLERLATKRVGAEIGDLAFLRIVGLLLDAALSSLGAAAAEHLDDVLLLELLRGTKELEHREARGLADDFTSSRTRKAPGARGEYRRVGSKSARSNARLIGSIMSVTRSILGARRTAPSLLGTSRAAGADMRARAPKPAGGGASRAATSPRGSTTAGTAARSAA